MATSAAQESSKGDPHLGGAQLEVLVSCELYVNIRFLVEGF